MVRAVAVMQSQERQNKKKEVDVWKFGNEGGCVGRGSKVMTYRNGQKQNRSRKSQQGGREGFERQVSKTQNKNQDSSSVSIFC